MVETLGVLRPFANQGTGKEDMVGVSTSSYLGSRSPLSLSPDKHCIGCKPKDSTIKGRCTRMVLNLASDEMLINSTCRIDRFLLSRETWSTSNLFALGRVSPHFSREELPLIVCNSVFFFPLNIYAVN